MATDAGTIRMPVRDVVGRVTLHVKLVGMKTWAVRRWIGLQIIRAGVRVIGMRCKIETEGSDDG